MEVNKKVKGIKASLKTQIMSCSAVLAVAILLVMAVASYSEMNKYLTNIFDSYLTDEASSAGNLCGVLYADNNGEIPELKYEQYLKDLSIEQLPSSYVYVVDATNSNMVYHPTKEKIGSPVSNEVILALCEKIQNGETNITAKDCVTYVFKGEQKKAAYSVIGNNSLIVVATADVADITSIIRNSVGRTVFYGLLASIVCLLGVMLLLMMMLKPLKWIVELVEQLAKLDLNLPEEKLDKCARKAKDMRSMTNALRTLQGEVRNVVSETQGNVKAINESLGMLHESMGDVVEKVDGIDHACNEIASGATSQAQETEAETTQVVEMGSLVETQRDAVEKLRGVSDEVGGCVDEANRQLEDVKKSNAEVIAITEKIGDTIKETGNSADAIADAVSVITEIAEQTNLLSLNASIEAARAGETGRGFAVVAQEIQKLAEQSNEAATKIADIIKNLIMNSDESEKAIAEATSIVNEQTSELEEAIESFDVARKKLGTSFELIGGVKDAVNGLEIAKNAVQDSCSSLTAIAEENAASTEETAASISEVQGTIEKMREEVTGIEEKLEMLNGTMAKWKM